MKQYLLFLFILFTPFSFNLGQITISQSDYTSLFLLGNSNTGGIDTVSESFDIGQEGGNNSWDFSSIAPSPIVTIENVVASTTPFASKFPGSTLVAQYSVDIEFDDTTNFTYSVWNYFSTDQIILDFGAATELIATTTNTQSKTTIIKTVLSPFQKFLWN